MSTKFIGGSFAPRIDAAQCEVYQDLIDTLENGPVRDTMQRLLNMVQVFNETPDSVEMGSTHPSGRGIMRSLSEDEIERIDAVVPWPHEIPAMSKLFDPIQEIHVRDCAHHLLWYAVELSKDRQPITTDML